ncbi:39S ribosomal protein L22 mitochondrial [Echinococcus multilocularis]|uniref:Large ribosomal subunit protein uL22m n=1 Tax=Echinococcus multilocularis TaxID=6211 RepID=A0A068YBB5_ECHMU|nr:39S ribosomal protein L22 mitochondrial [Echinococcus multilocularis]
MWNTCWAIGYFDYVIILPSHSNLPYRARMNISALAKGGHLLRSIFTLSLIKKVAVSSTLQTQQLCQFSTGKCLESGQAMTSRLTGKKTKLWELYNEVVYPPSENTTVTADGEESVEPRPAEVTYTKENILYSQKKLWLLAFMIRGLSVDEAFQQLGFRPEKGARILEKSLEAAIERAVTEHDVEFCTNLWVEQALVLRGDSVPRIHKGLRTMVSKSNYHYARLMLRLREGVPPVLYHPYRIRNSWHPAPNCPADGAPGWGSAHDILDIQIRKLRRRRIAGEL